MHRLYDIRSLGRGGGHELLVLNWDVSFDGEVFFFNDISVFMIFTIIIDSS